MGITKFKSFEDAEQALWEFKPDHAYFERIRGVFELAEQLLLSKAEPGLKKFRSFEERTALLEKHI
jgi:hypothetical protein